MLFEEKTYVMEKHNINKENISNVLENELYNFKRECQKVMLELPEFQVSLQIHRKTKNNWGTCCSVICINPYV